MTPQKKQELKRAFNAYKDATIRLQKLWLRVDTDDAETYFTNEYPFERSFDELTGDVVDWYNASIAFLDDEPRQKWHEQPPHIKYERSLRQVTDKALNIEINSIDAVKQFLAVCIDEMQLGTGFHPDTDFNQYIMHTGETLFYTHEGSALNAKMCDCFDMCSQLDVDIYELGVNIWKELKLIP